jgi:hypothetical protein
MTGPAQPERPEQPDFFTVARPPVTSASVKSKSGG